ncbi:MAG: threonylcarbamoyl-AMP synthase [Bacteroides sp.]|nr:threonylcarbamoyl-AMP synthase [Bacteroides sp.]MDE7441153.1 threonylcarbamoyl-AMP synthase [Muribaculaceae bacterium]
MKTIKIWSDSPSERQLDEIASELEAGGIMVFPTDTLYAIGCDALNVKAIDKICRIKGINPEKSNLSIICSDISMAAEYCRIENFGFRLLRDYTPGPFTFLFRASSTLPKAFKGRKVVGIRIPDCRTDLEIVKRLGHPVLTTSIEYEDEDYAINQELIAEAYSDKADIFVEGEEGSTEPSTIVDCTGNEPEIVRQGKGIL